MPDEFLNLKVEAMSPLKLFTYKRHFFNRLLNLCLMTHNGVELKPK